MMLGFWSELRDRKRRENQSLILDICWDACEISISLPSLFYFGSIAIPLLLRHLSQ